MKAILVFCALLPLDALACPDFSGRYKWIDEFDSAVIKITVSQVGCEQMEEEHDQGWGFTVKHRHVFDGQKRLVEDNGDFQAYETATIDVSGIHIREERHRLDEETGEVGVSFLQIEMTQPRSEQLVIKRSWVGEDGKPYDESKTTYTRF